jgi:hypothetical protein
MSNGVKIGLLVVVAGALAVIAYKMVNANGEGIESRPPEPVATAQPANAPTPGAAGKESANRAKTNVRWETTEHDFGKIKSGDAVEYEFRFTNTGNEPLIIEDAKASCGCTVPQKPTGPVAPGASDVIKVKFNSAGKSGKQKKNVTITANTDPLQTLLTISAEIEGGAEKK